MLGVTRPAVMGVLGVRPLSSIVGSKLGRGVVHCSFARNDDSTASVNLGRHELCTAVALGSDSGSRPMVCRLCIMVMRGGGDWHCNPCRVGIPDSGTREWATQVGRRRGGVAT